MHYFLTYIRYSQKTKTLFSHVLAKILIFTHISDIHTYCLTYFWCSHIFFIFTHISNHINDISKYFWCSQIFLKIILIFAHIHDNHKHFYWVFSFKCGLFCPILLSLTAGPKSTQTGAINTDLLEKRRKKQETVTVYFLHTGIGLLASVKFSALL